jgi:hypothetical protein
MLLDREAFGQRLVRGELLARRLRARLGRRERRLRDRELRRDVVELFLADRAGGDERLAPGDVFLRPRQVALRPRQVGLARRDLCPQGAVVDEQVRDWRTVCASCASAASSATRASAGSRRTRVWPALTKSVSSAAIATTVPATCGVSWTTLP